MLRSLRGLAARLREGASLSIRPTARGVRITDPGLPRPIEVDDRGGRMAVAYGVSPSAVSSPRARLADSSGFMKARAQLGEGFKPTIYVSLPPLLGFLRGLGVGEGLDVSGAAAYLVQLDRVIQGERVEGDRLVTRRSSGCDRSVAAQWSVALPCDAPQGPNSAAARSADASSPSTDSVPPERCVTRLAPR